MKSHVPVSTGRRQIYDVYYRNQPPSKRLTFEQFGQVYSLLSEGKFSYNGVSRQTHVSIGTVSRIANRFGFQTASLRGKKISKTRTLLQVDHDPVKSKMVSEYLKLRRMGLPVAKAAARIGINPGSAYKFEGRALSVEKKAAFRAKAKSEGQAHPLRPFIIDMLRVKNGGASKVSGKFRYSFNMIARTLDVDYDVVINANRIANVRSKADIQETWKRYKNMTHEQIEKLYAELHEKFRQKLSQDKALYEHRLAMLKPAEKIILETRLFQLLPRLRDGEFGLRADFPTILVKQLFDEPGMAVYPRQLCADNGIVYQTLITVIERINSVMPAPKPILVDGSIRLNPELAELVRPSK